MIRAHCCRVVALWALVIGVAGCRSFGPPHNSPAATTPSEVAAPRVRIVATNDFHGRLLPEPVASATGAVGGSALLAAHIDSARAQFDGPVLLLSAGDDLQGTAISNLSWGAATIASHNALRYTAAALGNHEFDWGLDTLRARIAESAFPWLAVNLIDSVTGRSPAWVQRWVMVDTMGVRVAVIGAVLPQTPRIVMADRVRGLRFTDPAPAIDAAVREARRAGADFVVVTMHIGALCLDAAVEPRTVSRDCSGEALQLAEAVTERVDLYVGGHTHRRVITRAAGVPIVEAASYSQAYSVTDLERRGDSVRVLDQRVEWVSASAVTANPSVTQLVERWNATVRPLTESVVAELVEPFGRALLDSKLGNFVADAFLQASAADVALVNNGSLRRTLPAGPVTYGMLYELQPFQNTLVTITVPGAVLRAALEFAVSSGESRSSVHVAGLRVTVDPRAPRGARVVRLQRMDGRLIADTDSVRVGLTDFVASGGDYFSMFTPFERTPVGVVDVDALVSYLRARAAPVRAPSDSRFIVVASGAEARSSAAR
jgi:2',3'-cyclic-nucleotide 2'-phosphodiesterase (5'-nucleotidase family)